MEITGLFTPTTPRRYATLTGCDVTAYPRMMVMGRKDPGPSIESSVSRNVLDLISGSKIQDGFGNFASG